MQMLTKSKRKFSNAHIHTSIECSFLLNFILNSSSFSSPLMTLKRIQKELPLLMADLEVSSYFLYESLEKVNNSPSEIYCIYGYLLPQTEPYKYGKFKVKIRLPSDYPFKPPQLLLLTRIFHPNIQTDTDCLSSQTEFQYFSTLYGNWSPAVTIAKWIKYHVDIIEHPMVNERSCPINGPAGNLYKQDREKYNKKVLELIAKYGQPQSNHLITSLKFV